MKRSKLEAAVVEKFKEAMAKWYETEWKTYQTASRIGVIHKTLEQRPPRPIPPYRVLPEYNVDDQHPFILKRMWKDANDNMGGCGLACFLTMSAQQDAFAQAEAEIARVASYMNKET